MRGTGPAWHKPYGGGRRLNGRLREATGSENGFSMILVLLIVALLMIIAAEFMYTIRVESGSTRNFKDEVTAHALAVAGINKAVAEILGDYDIVGVDGDGSLVFYKKDSGLAPPERAAQRFPLGPGMVSYSIADVNSKLNLNEAKREMIVELLRVTGQADAPADIIADSVLDWKDPNHEYHLNGAEDDYYSSLPQPYSAKDGPFETIEELQLVRGMSKEIFYGSEGRAGIEDYITVYGSGKVNINTAGEAVLVTEFGRGRADEILLRRKTVGYFDRPAYGGVVTSNTFSIRSVGEVAGLRVGIKAVIEKKPVKANDPASVKVRFWKEEGTVAE